MRKSFAVLGFGSFTMEGLDIEEPILPRKRKLPIRFQSGCESSPGNIKRKYREMYFESYDNVINSIAQRFNQPDMMYAAMQNILLMSSRGGGF